LTLTARLLSVVVRDKGTPGQSRARKATGPRLLPDAAPADALKDSKIAELPTEQLGGVLLPKEMVMSPEYSDHEKLLTKGEVAQLCRVAVRTVDRWLMAGKVGCHRTPSGRVLFRKRDVLTVVAQGQRSPLRRDR
jgi:hypothetical protein